MSSYQSATTHALVEPCTPKTKRPASDSLWSSPPPLKARRSIICDDHCCPSNLLLPDFQEYAVTRRGPLSYRPQLPESCFDKTPIKKTSEHFDTCPPALPLFTSDSSISDSSTDQSFINHVPVMVSFDDSELEYDLPCSFRLRLRPRLSFDEFDDGFFQESYRP